ncbi:MAG: hypothetical protein GC206_11815 [Alphaproteobacteria bacterium]|nr:hypothetical protein [Alphaproteobacteria bacterium]
MSQEQLLITLASGGAVLALILIAWALGFRDAARVANDDDVRRAIAGHEPAATLGATLIDARGRAALAQLGDGRFAAVRALGDAFAVRVFKAGAARIRPTRRGVIVTFADIGFPSLEIRSAVAPPDWLAPLMERRARA